MLGLAVLALPACQKSKTKVPAESTPSLTEAVLYTSGGQLWISKLSGESAAPLPGSGHSDWFPAVSPNFDQIAFWSNQSGTLELWIHNLAQNRRKQLTFFQDRDLRPDLQNFNVHNAPSWSMDGEKIVFSHRGKIWVIDRQGFNLETLVASGTHFSPAWSPDGKLLAFVSEQDQTRNLHVRKLATGEEWPITDFPASQAVGSPAWSPAGDKLAFTLAAQNEVDIWVVQKDGSNLTRLTKDGHNNSPAWSTDGKRLAFSSGRQDPYHWEIWVMNADGTGQFSITRNGGFSPVWFRPLAEASEISLPTPAIKASSPETGGSTPSLPAFPATPATLPQVFPTPASAAVNKAPRLKFIPTPSPSGALDLPTLIPTPRPTVRPARPVHTAPVVPTAIPTSIPTPVPTARKPVRQPTITGKQPTAPTAFPTHVALASNTASANNEYSDFEEYADEDQTLLQASELSKTTQGDRIQYSPKIDFYFAKDLIKPVSLPLLRQLAADLEQYPDAPLVVQCQARGIRWFPLSKTLSRARANSILRHLVVNEKIKQINITAIGEGDAFPELADRPAKEPILVVLIK